MLILAVSLISVTILFISFNFSLQEQGKVQAQDDKKPKKTKAQEQDDIATPKVSYKDLQNKNTDKTSKRGRKNDRHNDSHWVLKPESASNVGEAIRYLETSISDIPAQESNIILQGTVMDAQGFLSNDNSGVYSEYGISVENVLKNNTNVNLSVNDFITAEREGGIITYPSGKAVRYRIAGLGSPAKNCKYIFFLKKMDEDTYQILTAYEIQADKVIPLDGARLNLNGKGKSVFDQHTDEDIQSFLTQVQEKTKSLPQESKENYE